MMQCEYRQQVFDARCGKKATHKATIFRGEAMEKNHYFCTEHANLHKTVCDLEEIKP